MLNMIIDFLFKNNLSLRYPQFLDQSENSFSMKNRGKFI